MPEIRLQHLRKDYGALTVIEDLNLEMADGEFTVLVGPSGCGKSTLLRLIAGLEDITTGHIEIDGTDATDLVPAKRGLAMVFQSYALYPHMSVRKNIGFGLRSSKMARADLNIRAWGLGYSLQRHFWNAPARNSPLQIAGVTDTPAGPARQQAVR